MSAAKRPQTHMERGFQAVQENGWPEGKLYSPKPPSGMSEDEANELLEKFGIDAEVQPREKRSPMGEQIDAGYRDERDENGGPKVWSPSAHEVPIISEAIQWLRGQRWSTDDLELLAPHFPVEKSALLAADSTPCRVSRFAPPTSRLCTAKPSRTHWIACQERSLSTGPMAVRSMRCRCGRWLWVGTLSRWPRISWRSGGAAALSAVSGSVTGRGTAAEAQTR